MAFQNFDSYFEEKFAKLFPDEIRTNETLKANIKKFAKDLWDAASEEADRVHEELEQQREYDASVLGPFEN